ncbi:MAG: hypothetical protein GX130_05065 [Candidatus Hydrogenedens sp.]|jgi:hypothetical protein|nr:hypothetical protein [Candidatus Hydrogenedens sp.]
MNKGFLLILLGTMLVLSPVYARVPLIYCTDLFHPHDDPDDHVDLACIYAIPEFDLQAIVLDQGARQREQPGAIPISQMIALTGKTVPVVTGLEEPLASMTDTGDKQPASAQEGIETILRILRDSSEAVTIITVGSLRDVAAAFNREPALFHKKVKRLYSFIGNTSGGFREYNVNLDVNAYRCIMTAELPLYWTPCFDGGLWENNGRASYWVSSHKALMEGLSAPLLNFFLYMIEQKKSSDPVAALFETVDETEAARFLEGERNLWCCSIFPHAADRRYIRRGGECLALPLEEMQPGDELTFPFTYTPVRVWLDEDAVEHCPHPEGREMQCFHITDQERYSRDMTSLARQLLRELDAGLQHP